MPGALAAPGTAPMALPVHFGAAAAAGAPTGAAPPPAPPAAAGRMGTAAMEVEPHQAVQAHGRAFQLQANRPGGALKL